MPKFLHSRPNHLGVALPTLAIWILLAGMMTGTRADAQGAFPAGFTEVKIADTLNSPTAMAAAPDGRMFVAQQGGAIRIIKNDALLPTPFFTVNTGAFDEQGLSGIAFDPNFGSNGYVYVVYSPVDGAKTHQRISRITATGDVGGSELVLFELPQSNIDYHLGGSLQFGGDGKLYVTVGDGVGTNPQDSANFAGKVLRLNKDGTVPNDNPYCTDVALKTCAIWAKGFRNPFVMSVQPGTNRIYVNDVGGAGGSAWEEVNEVTAGQKYGFPNNEGAGVGAGETAPVYAYAHNEGCAVVGGTFYGAAQFPATYQGRYFFADYCSGWIRTLNPSSPGSAQAFGTATGLGLVGLQVGANGSLYYLARGSTSIDGGTGAGFNTGSVFKVSFSGSQTPYLITQPQNQTVPVGQKATFSTEAGGGQPLFYQWQKNNADISGAKSASYTTSSLAVADSSAQYRVVITNTVGRVTSTAASLAVLNNQPPSASISQPTIGTTYSNGQVLMFAGTATDPESTLQPSAYTWKIDLMHDAHAHPLMQPTTGLTSGTITVPVVPHATSGVYYRIYLTVSDGQLSATTTRDIYPAASSANTEIVNWGGDYVIDDTAMQRFITLNTDVDLDGDDATDDTRGYLPFSDTDSINPNPSGVNAYGNSYTQGSNWRFYGSVLFQRYNGGLASKYAEVWQRPNEFDQIYVSAERPSDSWMTIYWKKADFLNGAHADTVSFDANSRLEILNYAGGDGIVNDNFGRVRFVVKNGSQFYISEDYAEKNANTFTLTSPGSKQWAVYNPTAPYGIKFDAASAAFATQTFTNVMAVGMYHATDSGGAGERRAGFTFERFRVRALVGAPAPPATATPNPQPTTTPAITVTATPTHTPDPLRTATQTPSPPPPTLTLTLNPNLRPRVYLPIAMRP